MTKAHRLPDDARARLIRLCGMLGSDYIGERSNAAKMADELVRSLHLTWADVLANPAVVDPGEDRVQWCLQHGGDLLTGWERKFLQSLATFTLKQQARLEDIVTKIARAKGRAAA